MPDCPDCVHPAWRHDRVEYRPRWGASEKTGCRVDGCGCVRREHRDRTVAGDGLHRCAKAGCTRVGIHRHTETQDDVEGSP